MLSFYFNVWKIAEKVLESINLLGRCWTIRLIVEGETEQMTGILVAVDVVFEEHLKEIFSYENQL